MPNSIFFFPKCFSDYIPKYNGENSLYSQLYDYRKTGFYLKSWIKEYTSKKYANLFYYGDEYGKILVNPNIPHLQKRKIYFIYDAMWTIFEHVLHHP